ncbi:MAG: hypothetical protein AAFY17_16470, partial [Cyanobacteria bacterium J06642_11]
RLFVKVSLMSSQQLHSNPSLFSSMGRWFRIPSTKVLLSVATLSVLIDASFKGILLSTLLVAVAIGGIGSVSLRLRLNQLARSSPDSSV